MGSTWREDSYEDGELVDVEEARPTELGRPARADRRRKPTILDGPFTESKEMLGGYRPPNSARHRSDAAPSVSSSNRK
jgi:hypothetical protein